MRRNHHFVFRGVNICLWIRLFTLLRIDLPNVAKANLSEEPDIKYTIVAQRWLTDEEIRKFKDVIGYRIAIRIRLSNDSDTSIEYLASSLNGRPLGYCWDRKIDQKEWEYMPPSRGRTGAPGTELTGIGYDWRVLPPHSSVEGEALSYTAKDQEFAFSTFIRQNPESEMCEVVSNVIRPLSDR